MDIVRSARMNLRLREHEREILEAAASLHSKRVSEFVRDKALAAARATIRQARRTPAHAPGTAEPLVGNTCPV